MLIWGVRVERLNGKCTLDEESKEYTVDHDILTHMHFKSEDEHSTAKTFLTKHIKHTCTLMATNFFHVLTWTKLFLITFCPSVQRQKKRLLLSSHNVKGILCPVGCEQVVVIQRWFNDFKSEVSSWRKVLPPGDRDEFSPAMAKLFCRAYLLFFIPMQLTHASYHAASMSRQLACTPYQISRSTDSMHQEYPSSVVHLTL